MEECISEVLVPQKEEQLVEVPKDCVSSETQASELTSRSSTGFFEVLPDFSKKIRFFLCLEVSARRESESC